MIGIEEVLLVNLIIQNYRSRVDGDRIRNISGEDGGGGGNEKSSSNGGLSKIESEKEKKKEEERKSKSERERKEEEARRKRKQMAKNAPPPIDFQSLLKMANEKKDIPVNLEKIKKKSGKEGEVRILKWRENKCDYWFLPDEG